MQPECLSFPAIQCARVVRDPSAIHPSTRACVRSLNGALGSLSPSPAAARCSPGVVGYLDVATANGRMPPRRDPAVAQARETPADPNYPYKSHSNYSPAAAQEPIIISAAFADGPP